jgi:TRAP-type C4-dicarboxylate transport system permease small subunit
MTQDDRQSEGALRRALDWAFRIEMGVAITCLAIMTLVVLADVIGREVAGQGIEGAQKLAVYAFVCAGFLGLPLTTARSGHLRPRLFDALTARHLSPAALARMEHLPAMLISFGMAWAGISFVIEAIGFNERSPSLNIPVWWVQTVVPFAFVSSGLRHLAFALKPSLAPAEGSA